jgi:hypothetical protein
VEDRDARYQVSGKIRVVVKNQFIFIIRIRRSKKEESPFKFGSE